MAVVTEEVTGNLPPSPEDSKVARESSRILARLARRGTMLDVEVLENQHRERISLPAGAVRLLLDLLTEMAEGKAVTVMPLDTELTTQKAADILNVSRPFLIGLLESGEIPYRMVGTHRRVLLREILNYKSRTDEARLKSLAELSRQAQENDMGY